MSHSWKLKACAPLASAAILVACSGKDDDRKGPYAADPKHADARQISMTGCVGASPGTDQYMLTQIKLAPMGAQPSDASSGAGTAITEYSQVRLAMEDRDRLRQLAGQTASVVGSIKDDGRNTIGTSGPAAGPNDAQSPTDQSQAGTAQHHSAKVAKEAGPIGSRSMNNGTFPELLVQRIDGTGQPCQSAPSAGGR